MKPTYKILLICNYLQLDQPITYFSAAIRMGTCSKVNHAAILKEHNGHRTVIESTGKGVLESDYTDWAALTTRKVYEKEILIELDEANIEAVLALIGQADYGFNDILQLSRYIVKAFWLGQDYEWDGESGLVQRGIFCSELVALLLGMEKPHLCFPRDLWYSRILGEPVIYYTYQGQEEKALQAA